MKGGLIRYPARQAVMGRQASSRLSEPGASYRAGLLDLSGCYSMGTIGSSMLLAAPGA